MKSHVKMNRSAIRFNGERTLTRNRKNVEEALDMVIKLIIDEDINLVRAEEFEKGAEATHR